MKLCESRTILVILIPLLLRALTASYPHSGQDNHHGSKIAYGGDYEAQRHWMELTLHLPLHKWYTHDKDYWGLDYPPLIAYGSYIMGWMSHYIVGEESMELFTSRGNEDPILKSFMRSTVFGWDLILYIPILWVIARRLTSGTSTSKGNFRVLLFLALSQPALIIIDHGHFQYNSVCLGLALGSFHFMTLADHGDQLGIGYNAILGSVLFCLALNWKQMTLYFAPSVFAYLLGKSFRRGNASSLMVYLNKILQRIVRLGIAVIGTFGMLWYPFYHYRSEKSLSMIDVMGPIVSRIFPFGRGLFEGKVSNIWCVLSTRPISIRERIPIEIQPLCALILTLTMTLPFCFLLFKVGREGNNQKDHLKALLWGSAGTSLSFFLASFQVHEKSILLPLAPLSLLIMDAPLLISWFSCICMWTNWHLLEADRLFVPYLALTIFFIFSIHCSMDLKGGDTTEREQNVSIFEKLGRNIFQKYIVPLSVIALSWLDYTG